MPRWISPATIQKLSAYNDEPARLSEFMSRVLLPVRFECHPTAIAFHHVAEIGIVGDLLISNEQTETGYVSCWQKTTSHRLEIHFVDAGECCSQTSSQDVRAVAGNVYLLHDTREHRFCAGPGTRKTCLSIPFSRFAKLVSTAGSDPSELLRGLAPVIDVSSAAAKIIRGIAQLLHAEKERDNPFSEVPLPAAILKEALMQALASSWPRTNGTAPYRPAPRYLRRATEWINENLREKIVLHDIASAAGTSPRTLQALFQKQLGMSPMQYVSKRRLHHVHEELMSVETESTIRSIAKHWGFRSISDFERYYKKHYGLPPCETRRRARLQADNR